jgi:hypothetical protein
MYSVLQVAKTPTIISNNPVFMFCSVDLDTVNKTDL